MSRWKAAAIHLGLSATIATVLLAVMLWLWYPPPYFTLMGGAMLVILIAGCDVVLGPLITLIVFKSGKKSLPFDLAVIAFLQAAAMTYGLVVMFQARPVYTVFAVDRFEVTAANEIPAAELARASRPEYAALPISGPRVVGAKLPKDPNEQVALALRSMTGGSDLKTLPHLYVPYADMAATVAYKARPLADLERKHPDARRTIVDKLQVVGDAPNGLAYVPVVGRFHSMSAIVDRRSGEIRTIVDVDPW